MFPLVAFVIIGTAVAATLAIRKAAARQGVANLIRAEAIVAIGWAALAAIAVWPNGICYTNEAWGGTPTGYLYLSDSNYDWGQDLRLLAKRLNELGVKEVTVYTLDGVKRPEYLEQWYHLPPVNKTVDPLVPTPGWTVIGVTFDKSILPWDRKLKGDMSIPWWDKMEPRERLGGLRLYYVPGSAGGGDPGISTKGNR